MLPRLTRRANPFFMPNLLEVIPSDLNWKWDFSPQTPWPSSLPALAVLHENQLTVVAGFERKHHKTVLVLSIDGTLEKVMRDLYRPESLRPLEGLRFESVFVKVPETLKYLLSLPLDLQIFLDEKQVPIKALRPLEYLKEWVNEISDQFLKLKPSSSQVRELLDLLCDLKMTNRSWFEVAPRDLQQPLKWPGELFALRNPNLTRSDFNSTEIIQRVNWPRGVRAKWERQGDRGGITIQARVSNPKEFENLKKSLAKVEVEENLWTH